MGCRRRCFARKLAARNVNVIANGSGYAASGAGYVEDCVGRAGHRAILHFLRAWPALCSPNIGSGRFWWRERWWRTSPCGKQSGEYSEAQCARWFRLREDCGATVVESLLQRRARGFDAPKKSTIWAASADAVEMESFSVLSATRERMECRPWRSVRSATAPDDDLPLDMNGVFTDTRSAVSIPRVLGQVALTAAVDSRTWCSWGTTASLRRNR